MKMNFNKILILICLTLILILNFSMTIGYIFFSPNPTFIGGAINCISSMIILGVYATVLGFVRDGII